MSEPAIERRPVGRPPNKPIQSPAVRSEVPIPRATAPEGGSSQSRPSGTPSEQTQTPKVIMPVKATEHDAGMSLGEIGAFGTPEPQQAPWPTMETAPKDGKPVWVHDGKGNVVEAVWRQSRKFNMVTNSYGKMLGKWTESGHWTILNFSGVKLPFTPKGWRR